MVLPEWLTSIGTQPILCEISLTSPSSPSPTPTPPSSPALSPLSLATLSLNQQIINRHCRHHILTKPPPASRSPTLTTSSMWTRAWWATSTTGWTSSALFTKLPRVSGAERGISFTGLDKKYEDAVEIICWWWKKDRKGKIYLSQRWPGGLWPLQGDRSTSAGERSSILKIQPSYFHLYVAKVAQCTQPGERQIYTISFRSFSPMPGSIEFEPGKVRPDIQQPNYDFDNFSLILAAAERKGFLREEMACKEFFIFQASSRCAL